MKVKNYPINILKSKFLIKGNLNTLETKTLLKWKYKKIYNKIIGKKKSFILHDGPPYANGNIHLGHILNKVLKDIIIKFKNLYGIKSNYIIGWDCYGMPIEILTEKLSKVYSVITNLSKFYVLNNIKNQKNDFQKLGIFYKKFFYFTMNYRNSSEEIKLLYNFYKKNFLKKKMKPVYWCFKCKSSLSESEVIYNLKTDLSSKVIFLYIILKKIIKIFNLKNIYILGGILIWTTLPWTILSNQGLFINPEYFYIIINTTVGNIIISYKTYLNLNKNFYKNYIINISLGKYLVNISFLNPAFNLNKFYSRSSNINSYKNINDLGSGILHIAPAHGIEDYFLYNNNNNNNKVVLSFISESGYYYNNIPVFGNKNLNQINKYFLKYLLLNNKNFYFESHKHKYMFCWRHKKPIIYKNTLQWFLKINFKKFFFLKLNKIFFFPKKIKNRFLNILKLKYDWNLSRQRVWGVPMPFINHKKNFLSKKFNKSLLILFSNYIYIYGIKFWNYLNLNDFISFNFFFYRKTYNVLDVWFNSGSTHWSILRKLYKNYLNFPSDLCLEGNDQHRGWFYTSFITSILLNKKIPYKNLLTHGFVITDKGEKLSKSLNNSYLLNCFLKKVNIDILRLWISKVVFTQDVSFSFNIINQINDLYKKLRNLIKFIISNLSDFNYKKYFFKKKYFFDKLFINYSNKIYKKILNYYKNFNFKKILDNILYFLHNDLNNFYFNLVKDVLYIKIINSKKRKSLQFVLLHFLKNFLKLLSPILSFTSEESWDKIVFNKTIFNKKFFIYYYKNVFIYFWLILKKIKKLITNLLEKLKINFKKLNSYDLKIILFLNIFYYNIIIKLKKNLKKILVISKIKINLNKKNFIFIKILNLNKCKRCWYKKKNKNIKSLICKKCFLICFKQNIKLH